MKKVCHMTSVHPPEDDRIFHKECVSLAKAGYEVYLVERGESYDKDGVHIVGVGTIPDGRIQRMTKGAKMVYEKALELNCDIYHFHDPELLPYGLQLKKKGKKVVFDSHENTAVQISKKNYIPKFARKFLSSIYKSKENKVVKQLDAVIVPCTFDGKNIFDGRALKTAFISNYPKKELFLSQYDASIEKKYDFCYIGTLSYDRGIYHLVKAAGIGKLKLLLAGEFSSDEFKSEVMDMPEYKYVTYLGKIPNTEVAKTIQSCIAGANTLLDAGQYYHFDTFGVKVLEYMAVGLPVIMNDCPFANQTVKKYNYGICVKPDNPKQIADAVKYLIDHPAEARQMGENGRVAVEKEFNWSTQEEQLLKLYRELEINE